jgi:membrane protein YqaA with SNARE-associated domain
MADKSFPRCSAVDYPGAARMRQFVTPPHVGYRGAPAASVPIMDAYFTLTTLFISSFLAATLLPGGSEAVLFGMLKLHPEAWWLAVIVATAGNTLGGLSSYLIGRLLPQTRPLPGLASIQRYGTPALLLSWVPIVGDPLCVAAGWLRLNAGLATLFIAAGKFARYLVVAALAG